MPKYQIPGEFIVELDAHGVTRMTFTPAAGSAGYFGPEAIGLETGGTISRELASRSLWPHVQRYLEADGPIEWVE